jgi:hypothetical protein
MTYKNELGEDVLFRAGQMKKLQIEYGKNGKPYLPDYPGIYFNISHSGDYVAVALSCHPVGIDVQEKREISDGLIQKYKDEQERSKKESFLTSYIKENCFVTEYPKAYIKDLMELNKGMDLEQFNSYNSYYEQYYGQVMYSTFDDYTGLDRKEYYASLRTKADNMADEALVYQAIYEKEGLAIGEKDLARVRDEFGITEEYMPQLIESYGQGYVNQMAIKFCVLDFLKERIVIVEK